MRELVTPLQQRECIFETDVGSSFWEKTDKIIIVPAHLNAFVMKHYNQIFVYQLALKLAKAENHKLIQLLKSEHK